MPGPFLNTGIFQTPLSANTADQREELGVLRYDSGKVLRYVRAGALIPAGESVRYDFSTLAGGTSPGLFGAQVVQVDGTTNMFFGVAEATLASGSYGWVTIFGPATARVASATIPGSALGPSTAAGVTGILAIRDQSHFAAFALAVQTGLSAGSAVFITVL